jgi:Pyruvate/2-oxoacid:ferredoxin oxidoreductase delta subunit
MISVDESRCIGCPACYKACPQGLINLQDSEVSRIISFARCREDCDICIKICPVEALALAEILQEAQLSFVLTACSYCGKGFATAPMLERVRSILPVDLQKNASGQSWLDICPSCRREQESEKAVRQILARRS